MTAILVPSGPQYGVKYVLTGPDGSRAAFNDPSDPDYVGVLTDITGFDSPEVRESADDLVEMDGGLHGDFWFGRRGVTLEGMITHSGDEVLRNLQIAKLQRASAAMRENATLVWTPAGGVQQFLALRRNQPVRITGGWNKSFQLSMVAADPRIYSTTVHGNTVDAGVESPAGFSFDMVFPLNFGAATPSGQMFLINQGNAESFPTYYVYGPGTSPAIINMTTGKVISLLYTLGLLDVLIVDTKERSVQLAQRSGVDDVVNLVMTPTFEAGNGIWIPYNSSESTLTPTAATSPPSGLTQVGRVAITANNSSLWQGMKSTPGTYPITGLVPEQEYTVTWSVRRNAATSRTAWAFMAWATSEGVSLGSNNSPLKATTQGAWTKCSWTFTVPVNAARAELQLLMDQNGNGGWTTAESFDFDMISLGVGQAEVWGHGDLDGWLWASTPWQSQSRKPGIEINLATANDRYGVVDFANTQWSGLVPGSNDVRLSYFAHSEGAKLIADYRDAWM